MTKRTIRFCLILLVCCVLTSLATRWLVLAGMRLDCGRVVEFYRHKDALNEFVRTHQLADGEQINGDKLSERLRAIGIVNVYRNGRFVYFVLPPTSILADDATSEFFYQLDNNGGAIEEVLKTTRRNTYHIQHMSSAPRWYYWMHN